MTEDNTTENIGSTLKSNQVGAVPDFESVEIVAENESFVEKVKKKPVYVSLGGTIIVLIVINHKKDVIRRWNANLFKHEAIFSVFIQFFFIFTLLFPHASETQFPLQIQQLAKTAPSSKSRTQQKPIVLYAPPATTSTWNKTSVNPASPDSSASTESDRIVRPVFTAQQAVYQKEFHARLAHSVQETHKFFRLVKATFFRRPS